MPTRVIYKATKQPTQTVLNSGTGATYTTPAGATRLRVRMVASGSGRIIVDEFYD